MNTTQTDKRVMPYRRLFAYLQNGFAFDNARIAKVVLAVDMLAELGNVLVNATAAIVLTGWHYV